MLRLTSIKHSSCFHLGVYTLQHKVVASREPTPRLRSYIRCYCMLCLSLLIRLEFGVVLTICRGIEGSQMSMDLR